MQIPAIVKNPYVVVPTVVLAAAAYVTRAKIAAFVMPFFKGMAAACSAHPMITGAVVVAAAAYALYSYFYPAEPEKTSKTSRT